MIAETYSNQLVLLEKAHSYVTPYFTALGLYVGYAFVMVQGSINLALCLKVLINVDKFSETYLSMFWEILWLNL